MSPHQPHLVQMHELREASEGLGDAMSKLSKNIKKSAQKKINFEHKSKFF